MKVKLFDEDFDFESADWMWYSHINEHLISQFCTDLIWKKEVDNDGQSDTSKLNKRIEQ